LATARRGLLTVSQSLKTDAAGARVTTRGEKSIVRDGPFAEAKELIGGFFLLTCATREQAIEIAQDTWLAALEQWSETGIPDNPGAWLMATAKNRAIDQLRRKQLLERKSAIMSHDPDFIGSQNLADDSVSATEDVADDLLRLIFVACHPVLSMEGRVSLTLRLLGGLTPAEIARAFLTSESAIQQRIVRAKRTLGEA
jgi:RNA polymerase sigma-70 factor, ECF subfamily